MDLNNIAYSMNQKGEEKERFYKGGAQTNGLLLFSLLIF